jgi:hypothetical protein
MTNKQRKQYYVELLLFGYAAIAFAVAHTLDFANRYEQCDVIHENAPRPELMCEVYSEKKRSDIRFRTEHHELLASN